MGYTAKVIDHFNLYNRWIFTKLCEFVYNQVVSLFFLPSDQYPLPNRDNKSFSNTENMQKSLLPAFFSSLRFLR